MRTLIDRGSFVMLRGRGAFWTTTHVFFSSRQPFASATRLGREAFLLE